MKYLKTSDLWHCDIHLWWCIKKSHAHCLWRSVVQRASSPPGLRRQCTAAPRGSGWAGTGGWTAVRSWGCSRCGWGSRASCGVPDSSGTRPELTGQSPLAGLHFTQHTEDRRCAVTKHSGSQKKKHFFSLGFTVKESPFTLVSKTTVILFFPLFFFNVAAVEVNFPKKNPKNFKL